MPNFSPIIGRSGGTPLVVQSGTYADLVSLMDTARTNGATEVLGELYAGGIVSDTNLIGRWRHNGTGYEPIGPVHLDRVSERNARIGAGVTGSDLHSDNNAAANQENTEEDDATGWSAGGTPSSTGSEAGGAPGAGSYHLQATTTGGTNARLEYTATVENATDYLISFWVKCSQPNEQKVNFNGTTSGDLAIRNTDWIYYQRRVTTNATTLILRFYACATSPASGDKIMFDGVSILKIDDAATKIACNPQRTITAGDSLTVWDSSAGAVDETGATVASVNGRFVTLDSALAQTPEANADTFHAEGSCEFGEPGGTYWIPEAGVTAYWSSGLRQEGTGDWSGSSLKIAAAPAEPDGISLYATVDIVEDSAGADSHVFSALRNASALADGAIIYNDAGTWKRTEALGTIGAALSPSSVKTATGTPGTISSVVQSFTTCNRSDDTYDQVIQTAHPTLTTAAPRVPLAASVLLHDTTIDGFFLACSAQTGGSLAATWRTLRFSLESE